jgi:hypothetical protein
MPGSGIRMPRSNVRTPRSDIRLRMADHRASKRSTEEVFSEIYARSAWGGRAGELHSGSGSDEIIVQPYVAMLRAVAETEGFSGSTFVDLGCGDFRVGQEPLVRGVAEHL